MHHIDVLCVGATSYDFVFRVDHHPEPDEKTTADAFIRCGGGPAANASIMVSRMGLKAAFAGYLGSDLFGRLHLEELQAAGVNTDLVVRGEYPTPVSGVLVKPSGDRSLVNYRAADTVLHPECIDVSDIHPRVILFDGHEPELSLVLLREARAKGIKTVLDAGSLNRGTALLFDKVDYPVCSERFAYDFTGAAFAGFGNRSIDFPCPVCRHNSGEGRFDLEECRRGRSDPRVSGRGGGHDRCGRCVSRGVCRFSRDRQEMGRDSDLFERRGGFVLHPVWGANRDPGGRGSGPVSP